MSEQEVVVDDDVVEQIEETQEHDAPSFTQDDWQTLQEEQALQNGWKPFADYVSAGGDPKAWRSADAFNLYGDMASKFKRQTADFESRIEGVQKLAQAQIAAERARIERDRDEAIENGDKTAVHNLDKQLNSLNVQTPAPASSQQRILDDWNDSNPWIYDDSPKASRAKDVFGRATAAGKSVQEAIALVNADIQKNFSAPVAPRRSVPDSERGKSTPAFGKGNKSLTWNDLTNDELRSYNAMSEAWKSKDEFLKAVKDARIAERK